VKLIPASLELPAYAMRLEKQITERLQVEEHLRLELYNKSLGRIADRFRDTLERGDICSRAAIDLAEYTGAEVCEVFVPPDPYELKRYLHSRGGSSMVAESKKALTTPGDYGLLLFCRHVRSSPDAAKLNSSLASDPLHAHASYETPFADSSEHAIVPSRSFTIVEEDAEALAGSPVPPAPRTLGRSAHVATSLVSQPSKAKSASKVDTEHQPLLLKDMASAASGSGASEDLSDEAVFLDKKSPPDSGRTAAASEGIAAVLSTRSGSPSAKVNHAVPPNSSSESSGPSVEWVVDIDPPVFVPGLEFAEAEHATSVRDHSEHGRQRRSDGSKTSHGHDERHSRRHSFDPARFSVTFAEEHAPPAGAAVAERKLDERAQLRLRQATDIRIIASLLRELRRNRWKYLSIKERQALSRIARAPQMIGHHDKVPLLQSVLNPLCHSWAVYIPQSDGT